VQLHEPFRAIPFLLDTPVRRVGKDIGDRLDLAERFRYLTSRGTDMDIRRILGLLLIGFCALSLMDGSTSATESRTAKPESPPTTSLKPGTTSVPARPFGPDGDHRTNGKTRPVTNATAQTAHAGSSDRDHLGKDGAPMVLVPSGDFIMGTDKGDEDEAPLHRVHIAAFYIDKFEVTNARFAKYVEAIQSEPPWGFSDKETPVIHADRPVRWVSWMDAIGYCLWVGKRLPTEAEWEKAARGTDERMYPWGNDPPTPVHAVYGLKEGGAETVSVIGNHHMGQSPYGAQDLAGNLYEWVMDWYAEDFYSSFINSPAVNPRGPTEGTAKVQRGGSYLNTPYRLRTTFRTKADPAEQDHNVGFRCAQEALKQP
jgi:formylglycine-generating enzyme